MNEEGARVAQEEVEYVVNAERSGETPEDRIRVPLESLVGAQERIERLAAFIVEHWDKRRAAMEGKAMVVTMSRDIAARLYEAIRVLRPEWHDADDERGAMKVVVTGPSDDPEPSEEPRAAPRPPASAWPSDSRTPMTTCAWSSSATCG